jgi:hypothetical protein
LISTQVLSLAGAALAAPAFEPSRLEARDSNAALRVEPFSATVAVVGRLAAPPATCSRAASRAAPTPQPEHLSHRPEHLSHRSKKTKKHRGWFSR